MNKFNFEITYHGKIEKIVGNDIYIEEKEWAPGIWAGCEGRYIKIGENIRKIESIDYQNRILIVHDTLKNVNLGDEIIIIWENL